MNRKSIEQLMRWKTDPERKPLIIKGARQVGKTWLMKEFGKTCYEDYVYLNFDEEESIKSVFEAKYSIICLKTVSDIVKLPR